MKLIDFLAENYSGLSTFIVTTTNDVGFGQFYYAEGKYFIIPSSDAAFKNRGYSMEILKSFGYPEVFYNDWLYREIVEIDALADPAEWRKYFSIPDMDLPGCVINIVLEGDSDDDAVWEDEKLVNKKHAASNDWPYTEAWPFGKRLSKEKFEEIEELEEESGWNVYGWEKALYMILEHGVDWAKNLDHDGYEKIREEADGASDDERQFLVDLAHLAKDIIDVLETPEELFAYIRLWQEYQMEEQE